MTICDHSDRVALPDRSPTAFGCPGCERVGEWPEGGTPSFAVGWFFNRKTGSAERRAR